MENNKNKNGKHVTSAGTQYWFRNGLKHRLDGPAVIRSSGIVEYWIYGRQVTSSFFSHRKQGEDK